LLAIFSSRMLLIAHATNAYSLFGTSSRSHTLTAQMRTRDAVVQMSDRVHSPGLAGVAVDAQKTAVVFIEYQNEFATEGGKLHEAVKGTMGGMLGSSAAVADAARAAGATVMHAPITFKEDASDNPNKGVGILAGCAEDKLFTEGTLKLG
jgi:hypothetical protein